MAGTRVAVLFGGPTAEHEISIRSADSLAQWLAEGGCEPWLAHLRRDGRIALQPGATVDAARGDGASRLACDPRVEAGAACRTFEQIAAGCDALFPVVHGRLGEDGSVQGMCRVLGLACVGSGVLGSALALDKARAKAVLMATTDLRLPKGRVIGRAACGDPAAVAASARALAPPLVVKTVDGGSSVGLARVDALEQLAAAVEAASRVDGGSDVLIEELIAGDEVSCAVVGDPVAGYEAFPPILIRPRHGGLFDLEAKYTPGASEELCPAPIPAAACRHVEEAAIAAARALDCAAFGRVDFIVRDGVPWFLELNTLPGLTRESLFPKAARAAGRDLPALFRELVERAAGRRRALAAAAS